MNLMAYLPTDNGNTDARAALDKQPPHGPLPLRARTAPSSIGSDSAPHERPRPLRTRVAPSPTGRMHAGNVLAALLAWLTARRSGGEVILRIEDLDTGRSRQTFIDHILSDLEWLGFDFDGEIVYQSERFELYATALDELEAKGLLYPCFCTRADLHAASAPHTSDGDLVYPGTCRDLTADEVAQRTMQGRKPALRLKVPPEGSPAGMVTFHDCLQGRVECDLASACGDFIVRRSDGIFAYQLAVVVDDLLQGVDCLVRGCDLLASTPQQLYLRRLLVNAGLGTDAAEELSFLHFPLLVGADGRRLSKRNHDCGMDILRDTYRSPEALLGHIAHATGIVAGADEPMNLDEILARYDLDALKLSWAIEYR